jgi:hypothetical protein
MFQASTRQKLETLLEKQSKKRKRLGYGSSGSVPA